MKTSETPEEAIIRLYKQKPSRYEIRNVTGAGHARINNTINEYNNTNVIPKSKIIGRPSKKTQEVLKFVSDKTYENRFSSCKDISDQLKSENIANVSPTSGYRYKKEMKFEYSSFL